MNTNRPNKIDLSSGWEDERAELAENDGHDQYAGRRADRKSADADAPENRADGQRQEEKDLGRTATTAWFTQVMDDRPCLALIFFGRTSLRLRMRPGSRAPRLERRARCLRRPRRAGSPTTREATSSGASNPPPFSSTIPWSSARRNARSSGWMFFFRYSTASSPMFLRAQNSKSIETVIGIEVRIRGELEAHAFDHRLGAPMDDLHAGLLIALLRSIISQSENMLIMTCCGSDSPAVWLRPMSRLSATMRSMNLILRGSSVSGP